MLGDRRRPMRQGASQMGRHTITAKENLDGLQGDLCFDLLMHKILGNAIVMLGNLDMVVEVDPAALPLGMLGACLRL